MPKRACPFGDDTGVQLKTHVGIKQVHNGVCHEHYMSQVYERTSRLLFSGMKDLLKQNKTDIHNESVTLGPCSRCQQPVKNGKTNCSFCDKVFCMDCVQICSTCSEAFCSLCSLLSYDDQIEVAVCLTCYRNMRNT